MAIPAMISQFGKQQVKYGAAVGQTLAQLGQQVGQQLAMREYQKQAAAALPGMQASYREAFDKIGKGDYAGGYMQMMDTNLQSGALQNPFLAKYAEQAGAMAELAGKQSQSERWRMAQYGGGGVGGGAGLPAATPRERATEILLGEGQGTEVDVALPDEEIDFNQVPAEIPQQEPSISDRLNLVAQGAQSPKYKKALQDAAKNPPSEEIQNDMRTFVQDYLALNEASQMSVRDSLTKKFESKKELAGLSKDKSYYKIDGAERILGKGIDGLYLKPSVEALGVTSGKSESTRFGTNLEDLQKIQDVAAGAVSELNSGKIGDFISNQGGAFNVDLIYVRDEDTGKDIPYLVNKRNPNLEKPELNMRISGTAERINAINQAIETIKGIPPSLQRLNARGATASMIGFQTPKSEGPTREAVRGMRTPRALSAIFE